MGRASFGSWELGPPSASEMAPDLEMLPAPQYIYPALQYLHKTAQYMRSGVHTIFAHAPICVLTIICSAGRAQDLAGGDSGAETDLGRSSSSVLLLLLLHPCPSAGYRSPPCTWHPPPAASRPYHCFLKTLQGLENSTFYINWEIIKFALIFLGTIRITVETIVVV